jgi:hypothetical protein
MKRKLICLMVLLQVFSVVLADVFVCKDGPLRIRNGPNVTSAQIGSMETNDTAEIIEKTSNKVTINDLTDYWYKIKKGSIEGYVFGAYGSVIKRIENCEKYSYVMPRPYPLSMEACVSSNTSANEFIAYYLKDYFYPNVMTKDFYLSFYYPMVQNIPKNRSGLFEEIEVKIKEDKDLHRIQYNSIKKDSDVYNIKVSQFINGKLVKEKQFDIKFKDGFIEAPQILSDELNSTIKTIDFIEADMDVKINYALFKYEEMDSDYSSLEHDYKRMYDMVKRANDLKSSSGLSAVSFSPIKIKSSDLNKLSDRNFYKEYSDILDRYYTVTSEIVAFDGVVFDQRSKEILERSIHSAIYSFK